MIFNMDALADDRALQGLLSLLTEDERKVTPYGHNYKSTEHMNPQEVRKMIHNNLGQDDRLSVPFNDD